MNENEPVDIIEDAISEEKVLDTDIETDDSDLIPEEKEEKK